jgi:DNA-binding MarR family transcriptional regulator
LSFLIEIKCRKNINQHDLSTNCSIDKGAVARALRKLEEQGLVKREVDENNRRQNMLSLTEKGHETLEQALIILDNWESEVYKDITVEEKEITHDVLKKISLKSFEMNQNLKNE